MDTSKKVVRKAEKDCKGLLKKEDAVVPDGTNNLYTKCCSLLIQ